MHKRNMPEDLRGELCTTLRVPTREVRARVVVGGPHFRGCSDDKAGANYQRGRRRVEGAQPALSGSGQTKDTNEGQAKQQHGRQT